MQGKNGRKLKIIGNTNLSSFQILGERRQTQNSVGEGAVTVR